MSRPTSAPPEAGGDAPLRLDKWLWAARFYKTRALAVEEIEKGRIQVNGQAAKPAKDVRIGDRVELRMPPEVRTVLVKGLSKTRGPAPVARLLYEETPESVLARQAAAERRRQGVEPAHSIEHGRPTKRDRRDLAEWQRWSASADDDD